MEISLGRFDLRSSFDVISLIQNKVETLEPLSVFQDDEVVPTLRQTQPSLPPPLFHPQLLSSVCPSAPPDGWSAGRRAPRRSWRRFLQPVSERRAETEVWATPTPERLTGLKPSGRRRSVRWCNCVFCFIHPPLLLLLLTLIHPPPHLFFLLTHLTPQPSAEECVCVCVSIKALCTCCHQQV